MCRAILVDPVLEKPPQNGVTCAAWILQTPFDLPGQENWSLFYAGQNGVRDAFLDLWEFLAGVFPVSSHLSMPSNRTICTCMHVVHAMTYQRSPTLVHARGCWWCSIPHLPHGARHYGLPDSPIAQVVGVCPAEAFAGNPSILGYGLLNEPYGDEVAEIGPLYEDVAARIRKHDPDAVLFIQPQVGAGQSPRTVIYGVRCCPSDKGCLCSLLNTSCFQQPCNFSTAVDASRLQGGTDASKPT